MELTRFVAIVLLGVAACQKPSSAFRQGQEAARSHDWDGAVEYYERALAGEPDSIEYRIALRLARLEASRAHLAKARAFIATNELEDAAQSFQRALDYDSSNRYARDELAELLASPALRQEPADVIRMSVFSDEEPGLDPGSPETLHVRFPEGSSLRTVLESLADLAGINILFDEAFRDKAVEVDLHGVTYRELLEILMRTNGLFYKDVSSSTVVVENH